MSKPITMKSKLLRAGDPMQADVSQFQIPLAVDEALYERDLLNFLRRFAVTEEAPEIGEQDMATLTCRSRLPRFNKEHVTVRVGQKLFSKELESQILGWRAGQSGTVTVKGMPVEVAVERVQRESLPQVDDALAARCGLPGIRTAADIYAYCRGKQFDDQLEGPLDEAFPELSRQVMDASEFQLDPEELAFAADMMVRQFREGAGRDMDSLSDEDFRERFFVSKEEMLDNIRRSSAFILQAALLGLARREEQGRPVTEDDYAAWLRRYTENTGRTEEEARREHPVLEYLLDQIGGDYLDELEAVTLFRLKEGAV